MIFIDDVGCFKKFLPNISIYYCILTNSITISKKAMSDILYIESIRAIGKSSNCLVTIAHGESYKISTDIILSYSLAKGQSIDKELFEQVLNKQRITEAKQRAYNYAAYKPRSTRQVEQKLHSIGFSKDETAVAIDFLKEFKLLDDKKYALEIAASLSKRKNFAASRIVIELQKKGIDKSLAQDAVEMTYPYSQADDMALAAAKKKLRLISGKSPEKQKKAVINHLITAGFDWDTVSRTVKSVGLSALLFFALTIHSAFAQTSSADTLCKLRLPETINDYQPTIIPVVTPDGRYLFFDRKVHPLNSGGISDNDEIWYSARTFPFVWNIAERLASPLNNKQSNVLFSLNADGQRALVYTTIQPENNNTGEGFYFFERRGLDFINPQPIEIENYYNKSKNFYACASADSKVILLSVERDDGKGGKDIYISTNIDGIKWSEPVNLGSKINTDGEEEAPFLAADMRTLYFASNRQNGSGGLDLYVCRRIGDDWSNWSNPISLGSRINTKFDDNGIYLSFLSDTAYVVSHDTTENRKGIYAVCLPDSLKPLPYVAFSGLLFKDDGKILRELAAKAVFRILPNAQDTIIYINEAETYNVNFTLEKGYLYKITAMADGFEDYEFSIDARDINKITHIQKDIVFKPRNTDGNGNADGFGIAYVSAKPAIDQVTIHFEYNEFTLTNAAKDSLNALVEAIRNHPVRLLVTGFTDTLGSESYKYELSKLRAKETAAYLYSLGLPRNAVRVEFKGEINPVSSIDADNRRVEITIIASK